MNGSQGRLEVGGVRGLETTWMEFIGVLRTWWEFRCVLKLHVWNPDVCRGYTDGIQKHIQATWVEIRGGFFLKKTMMELRAVSMVKIGVM